MSKEDRPYIRFDTDLINQRTLVVLFDKSRLSAAGIRVGRTQSAASLQIAFDALSRNGHPLAQRFIGCLVSGIKSPGISKTAV